MHAMQAHNEHVEKLREFGEDFELFEFERMLRTL